MKTALITGATKGIGLEIAKQLGQRGFQILLTGRNKTDGKAALEQLQNLNIKVKFVNIDVGNLSSVQSAYNVVKTECEMLDVLINNAAILKDRSLKILDVPVEMAEETLRINLLGTLFVTQVFMPLLKSGSRVINISSTGGQFARRLGDWAPTYCISKAALNALTIQMDYQLRPLGILVNCVSPGWVRTDMGGQSADLSLEQGAETPVWLATDAPKDQSGHFWREKMIVPW